MAFNVSYTIDSGCPCKRDCPKRKVGCHDICNDYNKWKKERSIKKIKEMEKKVEERASCSIMVHRNHSPK